jgi:NAD(P)-dependent dehydrogenase (short-subunit alcohol dehydrogenase family)
VQATVRTYGGLHVLYNNAAIWSGGELDNFVTELSEDGWEKVISINLKGVYLCCSMAFQRSLLRAEVLSSIRPRSPAWRAAVTVRMPVAPVKAG